MTEFKVVICECPTQLTSPAAVFTSGFLHTADEAVTKLGKETNHPERLAALVVDISSPKSIETAAAELQRDFAGKLGGLINNAAVRRAALMSLSDQLCVLLRTLLQDVRLFVQRRSCVWNTDVFDVLRVLVCLTSCAEPFVQVITTEKSEDEYNRLWATNVKGTFDFSYRLAPLINEGALLRSSSCGVRGQHAMPGRAYCHISSLGCSAFAGASRAGCC